MTTPTPPAPPTSPSGIGAYITALMAYFASLFTPPAPPTSSGGSTPRSKFMWLLLLVALLPAGCQVKYSGPALLAMHTVPATIVFALLTLGCIAIFVAAFVNIKRSTS